MSQYGSPSKVANEQYTAFMELELQIVISELTDTLSPSLLSLEACQIVLQLMGQNAEYTKKNGKSDRANANAKTLIRLFELVSKFNNYVSNMNTLQLQNNNFYARYLIEVKKNIELQGKLDAVKNAEEWSAE